MNIGIMGFGTYIPKKFMTAKEIADKTNIPEEVIAKKFGVKKKPIPDKNDTTSYMGIQASKKAIEMAGISPEEIDIVIWNGGQHKDYPCWLAGLKIADELGADNAWSFDMEAMCGSMMVAFEIAKSLLLTNEAYKTVLVVSGYRNCDLINLQVPETNFMLDIGAGGSAVVLRKDYNRNVILGTSFKGDGSFTEDCIVPYGGTKNWPIKEEHVDKMHFVINNVDSFKEKLKNKTMPNFYKVIRESLQKSNLTDKDINYLAILHFKKSAHDSVLKDFNLNENQTTYLDDYGHIGQNDQILSLELGLKANKIKDGDNIVMVGAGLGFVWASAVVRWGEYKY